MNSNFDQHFEFSTIFPERSFSAHHDQENHFKKGPKRTFRSDFVKLGPKILNLFLAEKMVVCLFCEFVRFDLL